MRPRNIRRAQRAEDTLRGYAEEQDPNIPDDDELDERYLSDLLTDLMHYCDYSGQVFEAELDRARGHYEAEYRGEDDDKFFGCRS